MATNAQIRTFIERLGALAVAESNNRIAAGKGFVLPSVCIAQSALETGYGTSGLMTKANAFFGIKAGGSWTGAVYSASTWEVVNGETYNTTANFRAYGSVAESVTDYYNLIGNASRYANALSSGTDKSKWKTARECITAIWSGGYATDTLYVQKVMNIIEARSLTDYDALVTGVGTAPISGPSIIFTRSDFVQGVLKKGDDGRSIVNDKTVLTAISTDWSKAKKVTKGTRFSISGYPAGATVKLGYTTDTTAVFMAFTGVQEWTFDEDVTVGIELTFPEETLIEDVPEFETEFYSGLPRGLENYVGGFAYFVAIE